MIEKSPARWRISLNKRSKSVIVIQKYPAPAIRTLNNSNKIVYLIRGFKSLGHFMKSFNAVYIAAKTPKRERIMVNTGVSKPATLSSFVPPHVQTRIIPNIWNAIPEYLAKSFIPFFSLLF
jgi:hypothetical protein